MEQNKTGKYFKYAIGEIVLVVIGILIALSINNWNEYRKDRIIEKKVIREIIENIEINNYGFTRYIDGMDKYNDASDFAISILNKEQPYSEALDSVLNHAIQRRGNLNYSTVGYESLKQIGFDIIRNDSLRKQVISVFEQLYPRMEGRFNWEMTIHNQNI